MAKSNWSVKPVWTLHIARREEVARFLELVYPHLCSEKRAACDRARALEEANPPLTPHSERNWARGAGSKPRKIRSAAAVGE